MGRAFDPRQSNRREFLRQVGQGVAGASLMLGPGAQPWASAATDRPKVKVAAVVTEFTYRSHAHVILENFINPYIFNGKSTESGCEIVALYLDQVPAKDIGKEIAKEVGIPIYPSIAKALCRGGDKLAVDAVLSIGEHGKYPVNAKKQMEYPRKRFFDEIVAVFEDSGRVVPVFNDKHLSYRWDWAREMVETSRRLNFPFMAGSSVPLAQRRPPLDLPEGAELRQAVSIHGGGLESYDFHGIEVLQSMVESRRGGETGVKSVQFLPQSVVWDVAKEIDGNLELASAAMTAELGAGTAPVQELLAKQFAKSHTHGILIEYVDGLKGMILKVGDDATRWNFATRIGAETTPRAAHFYVGPWQNRNLFKALSHAIQTMFHTGKAPYPVERTLMTSGILDSAMDSYIAEGKAIETPQLRFSYSPINYRPMREMGSSWEIITKDTPEPLGLDRYAPKPQS
ncbi:hypothetical protein [Singulisphaera sp. PoT]|uniref:hypothetical protein n=1 Tax=Singulisphaera sp. PoT TaxID=3411797 RepID=UPI003BF554B3